MTTRDGTGLSDGETLVHIGLPKTGTTAVQAALAAARPTLRSQGLLYPGTDESQWSEATSLLGAYEQGRSLWSSTLGSPTAWRRLVRDVKRSSLRQRVISAECLVWATDDAIARLVDDLGSVRCVITLRPLERLLPSAWQQDLRFGLTDDLDQFLTAVLLERRTPNHRVGSPDTFDVTAIAERWAARLGADHIRVVIPPQDDARWLLDRFEELLSVRPGTLPVTGLAGTNRGLTAVEAETARRVNCAIRDDAPHLRPAAMRLHAHALDQLVASRQPADHERRITLPPWALDECRRLDEQHRENLLAMGVQVMAAADVNAHSATSPADAVGVDEKADEDAIDLTSRYVYASITRGLQLDHASAPMGGMRRIVPPALVPAARRVKRLLEGRSGRQSLSP